MILSGVATNSPLLVCFFPNRVNTPCRRRMGTFRDNPKGKTTAIHEAKGRRGRLGLSQNTEMGGFPLVSSKPTPERVSQRHTQCAEGLAPERFGDSDMGSYAAIRVPRMRIGCLRCKRCKVDPTNHPAPPFDDSSIASSREEAAVFQNAASLNHRIQCWTLPARVSCAKDSESASRLSGNLPLHGASLCRLRSSMGKSQPCILLVRRRSPSVSSNLFTRPLDPGWPCWVSGKPASLCHEADRSQQSPYRRHAGAPVHLT